jgi:glycosyltransferase involved in cell wall biosynthesis
MNPQPLVSISCVTYNQKKFIGQAIESFLAQKTTFPIEIVIGEDCSTDGTREIVAKYRDQHPDKIRMITSEENVGPLINGYRTKKQCRGKYIAICDGDDYWVDPLKLQKQVDFLEANPDYIMVYTDIENIDENGVNIPTTPFYEDQKKKYASGNIFFNLLKGNFINTLTVCYRADTINDLLADRRLIDSKKWYVFDYWYWLQIAKNYKIKFLNEKTAAYRIHKSGISRNNSFVQKRTPYVLFDAFSLIKRKELDTPEKRKVLKQRLLWLILNKKYSFSIRLKAFKYLIKFSNVI